MLNYLIKQALTFIIGVIIVAILLFGLLCLTSLFTDWEAEDDSAFAGTIDRCKQYIQIERTQHWKYFGLTYPYWYGIGQAKQESNCRANVTAFDAGMGLSQFMPRTWREVESDMGVKLDPYNPEHSIRAQAFYMKKLHKQNIYKGTPLFLTYQAYNGGWRLLKREAGRAGHADHVLMYIVCDRKVIKLKSGHLLDFCEVNYDYSKKVYKYGNDYRIAQDRWRYW